MVKEFNRGDTIIYKEEGHRKWFSFTPVLCLGVEDDKYKVSFPNGHIDNIGEYFLYKDMETAVSETLIDIKPYYERTIAAHKQTVARLEAEYKSQVEELLGLQGHTGY